MTAADLIQVTDRGLYCAAGGFFVDPWAAVDRAIITHAHSDHAGPGSNQYLCTRSGAEVLRFRLGEASIESLDYGESLTLGGVRVSLHPAGHILGSAQLRMEHRGEVWVVSGDYKLDSDATCASFEPVRCNTFISESTFGLPIYRWPSQAEVFAEIHAWWHANQQADRASVLFGYSLGKAQRVLAGLDASLGNIFTHGAVERMNSAYRAAGVWLPATRHAASMPAGTSWKGALILAPPLAQGSAWLRRFTPASTAFVSGWMQIRGARRRRAVDRGFVLSDHADWPGLLAAIDATGAQRVWLTHGYSDVVARCLLEQGKEAAVVPTRFEGERDDAADEPSAEGEDA